MRTALCAKPDGIEDVERCRAKELRWKPYARRTSEPQEHIAPLAEKLRTKRNVTKTGGSYPTFTCLVTSFEVTFEAPLPTLTE